MKDGISLIWLEIVLGFGAPLAWGFWELYALRRDKRRAERLAAERQAAERGAATGRSAP